MKALTILGARPQFIKAAMVSRVIKARNDIKEIIVHTGQHFDGNMSDIFFEQLDIPRPDYNLNISRLNHGAMTGRMLESIENILYQEKPDVVIVYGDTNSTIAGALAAAKLQIPIAHVESGLRSNNLSMPEELNRVITDRISSILLCPTVAAVNNLRKEGYPFLMSGNLAQRIVNAGDVMFDAVCFFREKAMQIKNIDKYDFFSKEYVLCTLHRQENTDNPQRLKSIFKALQEIGKDIPVVIPLHPRTRIKIEDNFTKSEFNSLRLIPPQPYLEMQRLQMGAKVILTDSGGVQKEAFFHQVPCITLRNETEWVETIHSGWNTLAGARTEDIIRAWNAQQHISERQIDSCYGNGNAADIIVNELLR